MIKNQNYTHRDGTATAAGGRTCRDSRAAIDSSRGTRRAVAAVEAVSSAEAVARVAARGRRWRWQHWKRRRRGGCFRAAPRSTTCRCRSSRARRCTPCRGNLCSVGSGSLAVSSRVRLGARCDSVLTLLLATRELLLGAVCGLLHGGTHGRVGAVHRVGVVSLLSLRVFTS